MWAEYTLTFLMLVLLQLVLGFDNLLYISIEAKRAPKDKEVMVRRWALGLAIVLRVVLLFLLVHLIKDFQEPLFEVCNFVIGGEFNVHSLIVLLGGIFIIYTAMKEIIHMLKEDHGEETKKKSSTFKIIVMILLMNLVFSFDSTLAAIALSDSFVLMAAAVVVSGVIMIWMSNRVSDFINRNRMYEVLGLFVLFVVGIMLVTEGGHLAHMELFGEHITPMSSTTFYFIIFIMLVIEVVQGKYQKKLDKKG